MWIEIFLLSHWKFFYKVSSVMEIYFNAISERRIPKGKSVDRIVGRSMWPEPPINPALRPLNIHGEPENANFKNQCSFFLLLKNLAIIRNAQLSVIKAIPSCVCEILLDDFYFFLFSLSWFILENLKNFSLVKSKIFFGSSHENLFEGKKLKSSKFSQFKI